MDHHDLIAGTPSLIPKTAGYVGLLILVSYFLNTFLQLGKQRQKLPPGPKPKPIIGNLLDLPPKSADPTEVWGRHCEKYGPLISLNVLGTRMIMINSIKIAKDLMDRRSHKSSGRPSFVFAGELCGYDRGIIFAQPSNRFRQMRKFAHAQIGSYMALAKWNEVIDVEVRRYLLRTLDTPQDVFNHIRSESGNIILKITYGYETDPSGRDVLVDLAEKGMDEFSKAAVPGDWLVDLIPSLKYLPSWFPGASFQKTAKEYLKSLDDMVNLPYDFVKKQMAQGTARRSLVSESIIKGENGAALTPELENILKWISGALYGGGADTTVAVMEVFYLAMTKFPDVQRKAQAEIDAVLGGATRLPEALDKAKMPYIEAVYKELLRWQPIGAVTIPHLMTEDDEYEGYTIPKGSMLLANVYGIFHDPAVYKDPEVFRPERFLGDSPEFDPDEIMWGFGRRICPGRFLAISNLWLQVSRTLACFDIKAIPGREPSMEFIANVVRRPAPFEVDVKVRSPAWAKLIRAVHETNPLPMEGDAKYL